MVVTPRIDNVCKIEGRNITINLKAFRKLSDEEIKKYVRFYLLRNGKKLKNNTNVVVLTLFGLDGR